MTIISAASTEEAKIIERLGAGACATRRLTTNGSEEERPTGRLRWRQGVGLRQLEQQWEVRQYNERLMIQKTHFRWRPVLTVGPDAPEVE